MSDASRSPESYRADALIVGGDEAAIKLALELADGGATVHHVTTRTSFTAPDWESRPELIRLTRHPRIRTWLESDLTGLDRTNGVWKAEIVQAPQYVDADLCTACGRCVEKCPVTVPNGDSHTHAVTAPGALEAPTVYHIHKSGIAPCQDACPVHQHAQGYIALIRERRYAEAYELIKADNPFPSICGRICIHYCEQECTRGRVDAPVAIMALKRFVADWAYEHRDELPPPEKAIEDVQPSGKRVAVIGAGPAGLTAAQDLVRKGHAVTVFEALPVAGGMLRVGVPPFRLPHEVIEWEVGQIVAQGVELRLNSRVDDIGKLLEDGYDAIFIATGAHRAKKLNIPGASLPEVWTSLELLRKVNLGEPVDLSGKHVLILGGGNVAIDVARTTLRLGAKSVAMTCLERPEQMPASPWELEAARYEGVELYPGRTFKEITSANGHVTGVRCVEVDFRGFVNGRPDMDELPGTEHVLPADVVIFAIGQGPDLSFLPEDGPIGRTRRGTVEADPETGTTAMKGVFAGADAVAGGVSFAIDAIAAGHRVAESIDRYLRGLPAERPEAITPRRVELSDEELKARLALWGVNPGQREKMPEVPLETRLNGMAEVELGYDEETALREAERCLRCGVCSECMTCVPACPANAIDHRATERHVTVEAKAVIWADTRPAPEGVRAIASDEVGSAHMLAARLIEEWNLAPEVFRRPRPNGAGRIGLFLCRCGGVISDVIDLEQVAQAMGAGFELAHVQIVDFACHADGADAIRDAFTAHGLDRAVLAACSCCSLDQVCTSCTTQRLRCKNAVLKELRLPLEMVNIREHAAFRYEGTDNNDATLLAADLIAVGLARLQGVEWPAELTATIAPELCRDCGDCVEACGIQALRIVENGRVHVEVDSALCSGCGACAAVCPTGAMQSGEVTDQTLGAMLEAIRPAGKWVMFTCNWGGYTGPEFAGRDHRAWPLDAVEIRLMCAGRFHAGLALKAFALGAKGVILIACRENECHYNAQATMRFAQTAELAHLLGIGPDRLRMIQIAPGDVDGFLEEMVAGERYGNDS